MEELFNKLIPPFVYIIEFLGVIIIIQGALCTFVHYYKNIFLHQHYKTRYQFATSMAMGLEFKLAAEILKTVILKSFNEILILASIFILRIVMTFIIHWELSHARDDD